MTFGIALPVALAALLLAGSFVTWIYVRGEFPVRTRVLLLCARLASVALVASLLWNPAVVGLRSTEGAAPVVLLDASASMAALTPDGRRVWDAAVERARALVAQGYAIMVVGGHGGRATTLTTGALADLEPGGSSLALSRALEVAAEAGAREVVLLTDRRVRDAAATVEVARRLGVALSVDALPAAAANLALARVALPARARSGEPLRGQVEVQGTRDVDSVTIIVKAGEEPARVIRAPAPAGPAGAVVTVPLELEAPSGPGAHRVSVAIEGNDAFAADDQRTLVVEVDAEEGGVVLISFRPRWEARFLLPVLDQVTGLPVRGFLAVGPDRFLEMGAPSAGRARFLDEGALARLAARSEVVVALGVDGGAADVLRDAVDQGPGWVIHPADRAGAALAGVAVGAPREGEWYLEEAPPSPIGGEAARIAGANLPPVTDLMPLNRGDAGVAIRARLAGSGQSEAILALLDDGRGRRAVVTAAGFWRWAARGGESYEHYRRLWASVVGWILADGSLAVGSGVRPASPVLPSGVPIVWRAGGAAGRSVALTVSDSAGAEVLDTVGAAVGDDGAFTMPALPPGRYTYRARAADTTTGAFEVEAHSGDMLTRPVDRDVFAAAATGSPRAYRGARSLRTWPPVYLLLLVTLSAEWVGRRRAGLR